MDKIEQEIKLTALMLLFTKLVTGMPPQLVNKYSPLLKDVLDMYRKRGEALNMLKPGEFKDIERRVEERVMSEGLEQNNGSHLIAKGWDGKSLPFYSVGNSGAVWEVFATSDKAGGTMMKRPPIVSSEYYKGRCVDPQGTTRRVGDIEDLHWTLFRGDNVTFTLGEALDLADDGALVRDHVRDMSA